MPIMLAEDFDEDKLVFPLYAQPKIDGVRALNETGILTGRSRKPHRNKHITALFSHPKFLGLDGEMAAAPVTDPTLCRTTSSALSRIYGEPKVVWWLFDYMAPHTVSLPYSQRLTELWTRIGQLIEESKCEWLRPYLLLVPTITCNNKAELDAFEAKCLDEGYEGVCVRKIDGKHKDGRSTVREGGLLRIKRFLDAEAEVIEIVEGEENLNVAQTNENGRTFRSSHQENKVPNGMIGGLICRVLKDLKDTRTKQVLLTKDQVITVSPGKLTHDQRRCLFLAQDVLLGEIIKFKFFPKGLKDKPRFPTFESLRSKEDM